MTKLDSMGDLNKEGNLDIKLEKDLTVDNVDNSHLMAV